MVLLWLLSVEAGCSNDRILVGAVAGDRFCSVCNPGSRLVTGGHPNSAICTECLNGTYQDDYAASDCIKCPDGATSPPQAFKQSHCIGRKPFNPHFWIAIGCGCGAVAIVILALVICYCCCRNRRENRRRRRPQRKEKHRPKSPRRENPVHQNPGFDPTDSDMGTTVPNRPLSPHRPLPSEPPSYYDSTVNDDYESQYEQVDVQQQQQRQQQQSQRDSIYLPGPGPSQIYVNPK